MERNMLILHTFYILWDVNSASHNPETVPPSNNMGAIRTIPSKLKTIVCRAALGADGFSKYLKCAWRNPNCIFTSESEVKSQ